MSDANLEPKLSHFLQKYPLKFDDDEEMDIPYGKEYIATHSKTTYKNESSIITDTRLLKLYKTIMDEAIKEESTDIQIANWGDYGLVRYRIGSQMRPYRALHKGAVESLITVFRDKSGVNPEKIRNSSIDGTIKYEYEDGEFLDTRLAFSPSIRGSVVDIRILYPNRLNMTIDDLGLADKVTHSYKQAIKATEGLILLTGGTGSGKLLATIL